MGYRSNNNTTKLPETNLDVISISNNIENPFLKVKHLNMQLHYENGDISEPFHHDVVTRKNLDAVVICAIDNSKEFPHVWLRSCVRPAIAFREIEFPTTAGNQWELPAGLIDEDEKPVQAAVRELKEEVGFDLKPEDLSLMMDTWSCVGLTGERLVFYYVDVSGFKRSLPEEDGSALERHGKCICISVFEALELSRDLKTKTGLLHIIA